MDLLRRLRPVTLTRSSTAIGVGRRERKRARRQRRELMRALRAFTG